MLEAGTETSLTLTSAAMVDILPIRQQREWNEIGAMQIAKIEHAIT